MARSSRTETITHDLGEAGRLSLRTVSGDVRVRTVDGSVAKVVGSYEGHDHQESTEMPPEASPILVRKGHGELEVEARNRVGGFLDALGEVMSRGGRTTVEWDVELPRGASLRLHGLSAELSIEGVRGTQEYHTVSGDISIRDVEGSISIHSVSGDASVVDGRRIALDATTTSGDVDVQAERFDRFGFTTVSGDIEIVGELDAGDDYRVQTVTGDLQLTTPSGVEVEASGPAVSIRADVPHRSDSGRGRKIVSIGDGGAHVRFRSMSGDVAIGAPFGHRSQQSWQSDERAAKFAESVSAAAETVGRRAEAAGRRAEAVGRRMESIGRRLETSMSGPWGLDTDRARGGNSDARPEDAADSRPDESRDSSGSPEPLDEMAVLRALERGEIGVAEASRLLSAENARYG